MNPKMRSRLDVVSSIVLATCAVIMTSGFMYRNFGPGRTGPRSGVQAPVFVQEWRQLEQLGRSIGSSQAPLRIVEFGDFECPACRAFHREFSAARETLRGDVALSFVHYPLEYHRFAGLAARAAECAAAQGRFEEMHNALYEGQDSLGLKPWTGYARDANLSNLPLFEGCIALRDSLDRVVDGRAAGEAVGVLGTPTLLINGWRVSRPPRSGDLIRMAHEIRQGKPIQDVLK